MKCVEGIWLPDHEEHLLQYAQTHGWSYQDHKLQAALKYVENWTRVIDVGAHVGLWSKSLVEFFDHVEAFEPVEDHRECFEKNVSGANLYPYALSDKETRLAMKVEGGSSGDSYVHGAGNIEARTLDSFGFEDVGFIKIDCEGYELFVVRGAKETLLKNRPVLIVEQKPRKAKKYGLEDTAAVKYLETLGAKLREQISGDYILTW